jgi:hypothetical protein
MPTDTDKEYAETLAYAAEATDECRGRRLMDLVVDRLKGMGRELHSLYPGIARPHYNGEGLDILFEYVVLTKPDEYGEWVIWNGCVRGPWDALYATTFQGYYSRKPDFEGALEEVHRRVCYIRPEVGGL